MKEKKTISHDEAIAMRVSANSIVINILLSALKLIAGILGRSGAMISDAVHSASDVFSTIIVMIGVHLSAKASDTDHPYGHERLECVAGMLLACVLFATGVGIGMSGAEKIFSGDASILAIPGILALGAAILSVVVKEGMFWYTKRAADKISSSALMADAWHHRSDALSSIGSFVGILGARLGFPILDPVASLVICLFILKASYDIFKDAMDKLVDKACDKDTENAMRKAVEEMEGVDRVDLIRTRKFGSKIYMDVEVSTDGCRTLYESHQISENVHDKIEEAFPAVKHCMVHVNPLDGSPDHPPCVYRPTEDASSDASPTPPGPS